MSTENSSAIQGPGSTAGELERRLLEAEKREVELLARLALCEQVLDGLPDLIAVKDTERRFILTNRAFEEHHGVKRTELLRHTEESLGWPSAARNRERDEQVVSAIVVDIASETIPRSDGRSPPFHIMCVPLRDQQHRIVGTIESARPIRDDESSSAEQQTERAQEHTKSLLRAIPDMYFLLDKEGTFVDFSAGRGLDTALPPALFLNKRISETNPDIAGWVMKLMHEAHATGNLLRHEYQMFIAGHWIDYEARLFATSPEHTLYIVREITATKQVERQLRDAEARFRAIEDQSMFGVFMFQNGKLTYANRQFADIFGIAPQSLLDTGGLAAVEMKTDGFNLTDFLRSIEEARGGLDAARGQCVFRAEGKDGAPLFIETFGARVTYGDAPAVVGVTLDITARQDAERNQRMMQEELIRIQEAMVVELSTPLIPISDDALAMPVVGILDERRAEQMMDRLLAGISHSGARIVIIDVTGLSAVTEQTGNLLIRCAQAALLLGAKVLLTGMRGEVARTLVAAGADFSGILTLATLQEGIKYALKRAR